jgi:hypothetical protein
MPAIDDAAFHIVSSPANMLSMILIPLAAFLPAAELTLRHCRHIYIIFRHFHYAIILAVFAAIDISFAISITPMEYAAR